MRYETRWIPKGILLSITLFAGKSTSDLMEEGSMVLGIVIGIIGILAGIGFFLLPKKVVEDENVMTENIQAPKKKTSVLKWQSSSRGQIMDS